MGVEGLRGGREGVRRPYFGSADRSVDRGWSMIVRYI